MSASAHRVDVVACYSYATGVSLELPVGFLPGGEGPSSADYTDADDSGQPRRRVRVLRIGDIDDTTGTGGTGGTAVAELAQTFAREGETLRRDELTVDDGPAVTTLVRGRDGVIRHETALGFGDTLVSVVASGGLDADAGWADDAVASIRYLPL